MLTSHQFTQFRSVILCNASQRIPFHQSRKILFSQTFHTSGQVTFQFLAHNECHHNTRRVITARGFAQVRRLIFICFFTGQHHRLEDLAEHFGINRHFLIERCTFCYGEVVSAKQPFLAKNGLEKIVIQLQLTCIIPIIHAVEQTAIEERHNSQMVLHTITISRIRTMRTIKRVKEQVMQIYFVKILALRLSLIEQIKQVRGFWMRGIRRFHPALLLQE